MTAPPAYPRVAHLVAGRGTHDDLVLSPTEVDDLLAGSVVVEEKVDGANVVVWIEDAQICCALRSGPGAMDRAGQLGPLRAWLGQHDEPVRTMTADGAALYTEWLLLRHSVAYDRLPAYLVVLDLWHPQSGFAEVDERNRASRAAGVSTPPELWRGTAGRAARVEAVIGRSTWGPDPVEGVVVRRRGAGVPRLAKVLRPGFERLHDDGWKTGRRPRNRLGDQEASWR